MATAAVVTAASSAVAAGASAYQAYQSSKPKPGPIGGSGGQVYQGPTAGRFAQSLAGGAQAGLSIKDAIDKYKQAKAAGQTAPPQQQPAGGAQVAQAPPTQQPTQQPAQSGLSPFDAMMIAQALSLKRQPSRF